MRGDYKRFGGYKPKKQHKKKLAKDNANDVAKHGKQGRTDKELIEDLEKTLIYVCKHTSYKIEEALEHNIDWLNMMSRELSSIEFEKNMFDLALHGIDKNTIDDLRRNFYDKEDTENKTVNKKLDVNYFRMLGLSVGKDNKTVVKR